MKLDSKNIIILDMGSQYTQLITRRIRELNVYSLIVNHAISADELLKLSPGGIILSGGPASVYQKNAPRCKPQIFDLGIPILGICYGLQLMVFMLHGKVSSGQKREFGYAELTLINSSPLFKDLDKVQKVWMSHADKVIDLPSGFHSTGKTPNTDYAAIANMNNHLYGLQFHPEVVHTPSGKKILENFCVEICKCSKNWTMASMIDSTVQDIQEKVGDSKVILGLSGGVDSSVAAALINKAIGNQLICVFINNGLLRAGEEDAVKKLFLETFSMNFHEVNAEERFLKKLKGVIDPEDKRKVIGHEFINVFESTARQFQGVRFLGQGTTYPDVIESVPIDGNPSSMIKSHHNVGGLPESMNLELVEPLRNLFKDEVREVGCQLGLPKEVVMRQPFPGPGLAVRIIGEVTTKHLDILRQADRIVLEEMKRCDFYYRVWQSFAVLLPIQSVGVMGDERTYENVIAVRAVESLDGMTADWSRLPYDLLEKISNRIINEVRGVNRICYDISSKPPSTIEWE